MTPMQQAVNGALTADPVKREEGLAHAAEKLEIAYAWLDAEPTGRT